MNLPSDVQFLEDLRLLIYRPRGLLNEGAVNKIVRVIGDLEAASQEPFDRFCDTFAQDEVELNFRYMIHVSLYRRLSYSNRPPVKSAILATNSTIIHYAKLHAILTQGSPIKVRLFTELKEATKWLKVPLERVMVDPSEQTNPGASDGVGLG